MKQIKTGIKYQYSKLNYAVNQFGLFINNYNRFFLVATKYTKKLKFVYFVAYYLFIFYFVSQFLLPVIF